MTKMGLVVPPRDPAGMARGILEVLANRNAYVRPAEEIHGIFNLERSVTEYESLLARLAAGGASDSRRSAS